MGNRRWVRGSIAALALLTAVAACGDDGGDEADAPSFDELVDDATSTTAPADASDGTTQTTSVVPGTLVITPSSIGDVEVGMTLAEADATGVPSRRAPARRERA